MEVIFLPERNEEIYNSFCFRYSPWRICPKNTMASIKLKCKEQRIICLTDGVRDKTDNNLDEIWSDCYSSEIHEKAGTGWTATTVRQFQIWTTFSGIIDGFPNMPHNFIVRNATNAYFTLQSIIELPHKSSLTQQIYTVYVMNLIRTSHNLLLWESINVAHHQPHVKRLQQTVNYQQVMQHDKTRLTKDWQCEIMIQYK